MKKTLLTLCIISFFYSQYSLKGHIKDDSSEGLIQISIYFDNTTLGTTSGADGFYEIKHIPAGSYKLIAESPGYEKFIISIDMDSHKTLNIRLREKIYQSELVDVVEKNPDQWQKMLRTFKREFLGQSKFASDCKIENPEVMNFTRIDASSFTGKSDKVLKVVNNALGYRLHINVIIFKYGIDDIKYANNIRFEELKTENNDLLKKWEKNRSEAFHYSARDLFQSIYNEEESERFKFYTTDYLPKEKRFLKDEIAYHDIMATDKYGDTYLFTNKFLIIQSNKTADNYFLSSSKKTIFANVHYITSIIKLNDKLYLNKNGIVDLDNVKFYGYFAFQRIADTLPLNYSKQ